MDLNQLITNLIEDLAREYQHLNYYLRASTDLVGVDRAIYQDFFKKSATSEFGHVQAFRNLIVGLGGTIPPLVHAQQPQDVLTLPTDAKSALTQALDLEKTVVAQYIIRMGQCDALEEAGNGWIAVARQVKLFLEDQLQDSLSDLQEIELLLK